MFAYQAYSLFDTGFSHILLLIWPVFFILFAIVSSISIFLSKDVNNVLKNEPKV